MATRECTIDGCSNKYFGRGWCNKHWQRWRAHGDPSIKLRNTGAEPLRDRFEEKIDRSGGPDSCHEWTGSRHKQGYGSLSINRRHRSTHHVAWFLEHGYWPKYLLHSCDNPPCGNLRHLSEGTHTQNMREAIDRGRRSYDNPTFGEARSKKLTRAQVREIFSAYHAGNSLSSLASAYSISVSTAYNIGVRNIWRRDTEDLKGSRVDRISRLRRGENHQMAKASYAIAREIRGRVAAGEKRRAMAEEYRLSLSVVQRIVAGEAWVEDVSSVLPASR